ncbi:PAS domain S-box protein [Aromatoleum toluclasticum]|uniref:PAS domain-containing hybrid sensor histidine kinase/response regulator n=1 Tax=Aromatoleum toluclasticum TaxID=92003 RepID=UPI001D1894FE|nr:PAS domain-containing hybrid sensor histidine kinase/response regulator [Aromatoleum toluclasticum]MCC4115046.1 PAS domain S-box protein [Aromatoleum toluclasticum]
MEGLGTSHAAEIARLEDELARCKAGEERARQLIETAPDAIVVVDNGGRILLVNTQTERLFGYAREELVGQSIEVLVPQQLRGTHVGKRDAYIGKPSVRPMGTGLDLAGQRKDGSQVPIEISLSPLGNGDNLLISAAIRDITERRAAQEALRLARDELELRVRERTAELEQANRALQAEMEDRAAAERALHQAQKMEAVGQLTGGIAHDFNNLLTVVMGNLQLLARRVPSDPAAAELIKGAMDAAWRGAELNRRLLAFSRKQRLAPVPLDLNDLIAGMTNLLRRSLGEHINIKFHAATDLPPALADITQLESALLNLAVNSRDAMPEGGTLTIETGAVSLDEHYATLEDDVKPGAYVMLAVSDTGCGMPPEVVQRAFDPFFTTKETGKGSGLGLAMVYGFVKQSGGHVKIYSEPGTGATVKLFLPIITRPAGALPADAPAPRPDASGCETILVVEDEDNVRELVCRVLGGLGYRILQAPEGRTALGLLAGDPGIDLLFTDVILPGGMNGPEIARHARQLRPDLKLLYTSGYTGNALLELEAIPGEFRLISKPYVIEDLAQMVREVLDTPSM